MNKECQRIPTHDYMGRQTKVGEKAIIFSRYGIHHCGKIVQIGGKRWFLIA